MARPESIDRRVALTGGRSVGFSFFRGLGPRDIHLVRIPRCATSPYIWAVKPHRRLAGRLLYRYRYFGRLMFARLLPVGALALRADLGRIGRPRIPRVLTLFAAEPLH